jgi:hypothetical protein
MNDTTRNLILLTAAAAIGYFIWKDSNTSATAATSNSTAQSASQSNLSTSINGYINTASGYLNQPVLPSQLATSLDDLGNALGITNVPATMPSYDSSGEGDDGSGD